MIRVNEEKLKEVVEFWVESFNDCACFPFEFTCLREGIDVTECADDIIVYHLQKEV